MRRQSARLRELRNPSTSSNNNPTSYDPTNTVVYHEIRPRIYKRWIVISSAVTLLLAWIILPRLLFTEHPIMRAARLEDFWQPPPWLFEGSDELLGNLTSIILGKGSREDSGSSIDQSPGLALRERGAAVHFPVLMIPGVVSTGLEQWVDGSNSKNDGNNDAKNDAKNDKNDEKSHKNNHACAKYFRQRFWGSLTMLRVLLTDRDCWIRHLRLDPHSWSDPPGVKLRAAQGLEAADFLLPGFWVWARIIENLAYLGYDHNNLQMAPYDWRLDHQTLEVRDGYLTRLQAQLETLSKTNGGRRVVVLCHSAGTNLLLYFFKWIQLRDVGWVERHIQAMVNIGGPLLGVPKSVSLPLSGEMKDTAQLGPLEAYILEMVLSQKERVGLMRHLYGGFIMAPKGGTTIWSHAREIPTEHILQISGPSTTEWMHSRSFTFDQIDQILPYCFERPVLERYRERFSTGIAHSTAQLDLNDQDPSRWNNPLEVRLPAAPSMRIYCLYGVGRPTEVAYQYRSLPLAQLLAEAEAILGRAATAEDVRRLFLVSTDPRRMLIPLVIDRDAEDPDARLQHGIYMADGDGTVPLISLGYMCVKGWQRMSNAADAVNLNPSAIKVVTKEYLDVPAAGSSVNVRGGPKSGDHVDILGNYECISDVLRIAANFPGDDGDIVEERIISRIKELSDRVNL